MADFGKRHNFEGHLWFEHHFSPWRGCGGADGEACESCVAQWIVKRRGRRDAWGPTAEREFPGSSYWDWPEVWNRKARRESRYMPRVVTPYLSELFEIHPLADQKALMDNARHRLWGMIEQTQSLDWIILTKKPENAAQCFPKRWTNGRFPTNLTLAVSVESQINLDRVKKIMRWQHDGIRLGLVIEPVLTPVEFDQYAPKLAWVVAGGQIGPRARRLRHGWIQAIRDTCERHKVPFIFSRWGEFDQDGDAVGREKAGRHLDGVIHEAYPWRNNLDFIAK